MDQKLPLEEFPAFHTCNYKIKEEVDDKEFEVEELHHSIDIKEESTALEPEQIKCECYLCGIQFHDKSQLIEHLETQCLEKPFSCEICALRYLTKQQLNRHTKTHIGSNNANTALGSMLRAKKEFVTRGNMDVELLISEIYKRPVLWDQREQNHHNRFVLDKLWDEVANRVKTQKGQIEESKEKEKSRKEKKKLETEISIGKTRQWIERNTFENFDYDLTQRKLKKDEDNFFDTSTDRVYDYPSCLRSNGNKSESNISRDEAIDDSGNQHFNIIDIYQHSDTSYPTSANKLSRETARERSKETKLIRCKFCTDEISTKNFMRHLERQHKLEKEVKEILKYPRNSRERRQAFGLYRNQINFNLYINGLTNPNRLLAKASSYYPCAYCRGLYLKNYLKRHVKTCFVQKQSLGRTEGRRKYYLSHAQTVTACAMDPTDLISKLNVKEKVFNFMKVDEISFEAKKDLFIAHFGESYLRNHKVNRLTHTTCSNKLRELSRLLINYRKIVNDNEISFKDLLHSKNFDNVIVAAREVAGYDQVKNTFKAPTLALHLGTTLKSACDELIHLILKKSKGYQCSSTKDLQTWLNSIRDFKRLVETHWSTQLACKDLMTKKSNKSISLPMVGDVQQFRTRSEKSVLEINREYIKEDSGEDSHESYNTEDFQNNRKSRRKRRWNSMIPMPESAQDLYRPSCGSPAVPKHDHADLLEPKLEFVSITSKSWSDSLSEPCSPSRSESPRRESSSFLQSCEQHAEDSRLVKSKRIRKPDFCFFCETDVFNFARHIKRIHISELEVTKIFALEINSNERKDLIATLRKRGNFKKRSQICRKPVRSSKLDRLAEKCVPCKHCLGFYSSKQLWRHIRKCKLNKGDSTTTFSHLTDAQNLLLEGMAVDQELADTVFPRMLADKISLVAKKDEVICMFGAHYLKRHREKHYIHVCSRKMRELSRLLIAMMDAEPSVKSMYDVLQPQNFDLIVQCTKEVAKLDSKTDNCRSSTYATNINNSLKKCCDIAILNVAKGESMEFSRSAEESKTDFKKTRYLLHDSWCFEASPRTAVPTVTSIAWNKISIITLTNDVKIFKAYLEAESGNAYSELEQNEKNSKAFQTLMETVFCRLLLLNRGRISELESLPLQVYIETDSAQNDSVDATLTERILLKNFKRVLIRNSRGNEVPVLFSADLQHHTKKLIELRKHFVYSNNIFLFASLRRSISVVGSKVFNKYATGSGAEDPTALTSIRLRKCLATISQLLSMSGGEIEQLATSMGHTADVQPPDDVDRIAKITKLLLLRENGEAAQYEGKELDQIDINLEIVVDDLNCSDDDSGPSETAAKPNTTNIKNTKKQRRIIVPWTEDQKRKTIKFFARHIKSKQPPKRFEVEELKSQTGDVFDNKSWQQVKVFVQNQYTRK